MNYNAKSQSALEYMIYEYEAEERLKGKRIKFVPLWKWLLDIK